MTRGQIKQALKATYRKRPPEVLGRVLACNEAWLRLKAMASAPSPYARTMEEK